MQATQGEGTAGDRQGLSRRFRPPEVPRDAEAAMDAGELTPKSRVAEAVLDTEKRASRRAGNRRTGCTGGGEPGGESEVIFLHY